MFRLSILLMFAVLALTAACSPAAAPTPTTAPTTAPTIEPTQEITAEATSQAVAAVECTLFNLNTVTADQLLGTLPDFSNRMVREFFEYRPYVSIQQFRREIGKYVDEAQVAAWEAYVYVPVDPNDSDAATLQQLPGVDDAIASALIAGRPYADQQAFVAALADAVGAEVAAQADCYLTGA